MFFGCAMYSRVGPQAQLHHDFAVAYLGAPVALAPGDEVAVTVQAFPGLGLVLGVQLAHRSDLLRPRNTPSGTRTASQSLRPCGTIPRTCAA